MAHIWATRLQLLNICTVLVAHSYWMSYYLHEIHSLGPGQNSRHFADYARFFFVYIILAHNMRCLVQMMACTLLGTTNGTPHLRVYRYRGKLNKATIVLFLQSNPLGTAYTVPLGLNWYLIERQLQFVMLHCVATYIQRTRYGTMISFISITGFGIDGLLLLPWVTPWKYHIPRWLKPVTTREIYCVCLICMDPMALRDVMKYHRAFW